MAHLIQAVTSRLSHLLVLATLLSVCSAPLEAQRGEFDSLTTIAKGGAAAVRPVLARYRSAEPLQGGVEASSDTDWIANRWAEVVRVERLIAANDLDSARTAMLEWMEPGLDSIMRDLAAAQREELAQRIDDLAGTLSLLEVQLAALRTLHEQLGLRLGDEDLVLLRAKFKLANALFAVGDFKGTFELREFVHEAWERLLPPDHPDLLSAKTNLAISRSQLGDPKGALELDQYVHAARSRLLPPNHPELLSAKSNLANSLSQVGDIAGARELREYVHAAMEQLFPPDHPKLLAAKTNLAISISGLGDPKGALELREHVHAALERLLPPDHPKLLRAKANLAGSRSMLGDSEGALELDEYVHAAWLKLLPPDHPSLLSIKQNLASSRSDVGDLKGALELQEFVHAAKERSLPPEHPELLTSKHALAISLARLGNIERGLELLEYVHEAQSRLLPPDHSHLLMAKQSLAGAREAFGDLEGSLELREYVHAAWARLLPPDHQYLLQAKLGLASARFNLGDFEGALGLYEYVHSAWERLLPADHLELLAAKHSLASTRSKLGDLAGALELREYVHAAEERLLPAEHPDLLLAKYSLANSRFRFGDLEGALELREHVHDALERLLPPDHSFLLDAKVNLAVSRHFLGDFEGLRAIGLSLLAGQIAVAEGVAVQAPRLARSAVLRELKRIEKPLSWSESMEARGVEGLAAELHCTLENLRLASTSTGEVASAAADVPDLAPILESLVQVRRKLADRSSTAPSDPAGMDAWRSELVGLSEQRDRLEKSVRTRLKELGLRSEMPSAREIAAGLGEDAALVSFLRYDRDRGSRPAIDSLLAFVMTPDARVRRVELGPAAELKDLIGSWRAQLGEPIEGVVSDEAASDSDEVAVGRTLRKKLLDPCLAALGDVRPARLHVVLDDLLHLVPIDALPNDEGARVGESLAVHVETSVARLVRPVRERKTGGTLVAFGGVDYGSQDVIAPDLLAYAANSRTRAGVPSHFAALLSSRIEVEFICTLFEEYTGGEPLLRTRAEASKAELVIQASDARYLHVATHGWFASESAAMSMLDEVAQPSDELRRSIDRAQDTIRGFLPETLCGLALAGGNNGSAGILTAEELATLDLTNCELAVLSACETNVGIRRAGQGIQSLQTALHTAGALTAITSLWKVDDAATRRLFEVFYTKLWKDGLGKADALWQAKMALRSEGHALRDWAGWVLTGEPR